MKVLDEGASAPNNAESRKRTNKRDPWLQRMEAERDDPKFQIPNGATVISLKSWEKDKVNFDIAAFKAYFDRDQYGMYKPIALTSDQVRGKVDRFRSVLRSDDRLYKRVSTINKRTAIRNTNRPQSTSPVKGGGLKIFGPPEDLSERTQQEKVVSNSLDSKTLAALENRLHKEFQYIRDVDNFRIKTVSKSDDPVLKFLDEAEKHQVLTGGGYDNTHIGQAREVSFNWLNKEITPIYNTKFSLMTMNNLGRLQAQFDIAGIGKGSLNPVDFTEVRDLSNTDGTIGIPILVHGKDILTVDIANSIRDCYGVDMRSYVGAYVKLENYTGPVRVKDALNDLPFLMDSIGPEQMCLLVTQLSRTQRKGYKKLDVPKDGKFRTVKMPEALHSVLSGAIATAFKKASKEGKLPPFLDGQRPLSEQKKVIFSEMKRMVDLGFTGFPLDESAFDSSLHACIMATIILDVYQPLFSSNYEGLFWAVAYGFCNKIVLTPMYDEEEMYYASHGINPPKLPKNTILVKGFACTYIQDKLLSGDYLTQHIGSSYNILVVQLNTYTQLGYDADVPVGVGKALGDDVLMYIPKKLIDDIGINNVLKLVERALSNFSIEANASKQYVIRWDPTGEYLVVFLQRYYCVGANVDGWGSPARSAASYFFSEYSPLDSRPPQPMALQLIGEISTANNGYDYPTSKEWIKFLFEKDDELFNIFYVYGESAFEVLTKAAGGQQAVIDAMSHLVYSPASGAAAVVEGQGLPILEQMVEVAHSMGRVGGSNLPSWLTKEQGLVMGQEELQDSVYY